MHPTQRQRGFTLIEILAVVFVIGIAVGGVSVFITNDSPNRQMDKMVERFTLISDHATELAILNGDAIGLYLEPPLWRENPLEQGWRYQWLKEQPNMPGRWQALSDIPPVEFGTQVELNVFIDELEWEYENAPEHRLPIAVFYPSGEVTPFEIEFTHDQLPGQSETVMVDVWGEVVWKEFQEQKAEQEKLEAMY